MAAMFFLPSDHAIAKIVKNFFLSHRHGTRKVFQCF